MKTGRRAKPVRPVLGLLAILLPALLAAQRQGFAAPLEPPALPDPQAVRQALDHLAVTYETRFPQAPALRQRWEQLRERTPADEPWPEELQAAWRRLQRDVLTAHPQLRSHPLLYVVRRQYTPDHHNTATFFPAAPGEYNNGRFTPGAALKVIDLTTGAVRTLLATETGVIRDPEVDFDGRRIVFSMRRDAADSYHIYEIQADGRGLRQLTFAPGADDLDPCPLPDGSIVFASTREPKYCGCNRHIMANLFRMEADGANIHQIGHSTLFEGHPVLLPDGRILYDRWEYVDRNFGDAQALWTCNPDGTAHALFWGNNTASPGAVIDARVLPGSGEILCVFSSCHDRPWGALALLDRRLGLDGRPPVVRTWPADAIDLVDASGWQQFDRFKQVRLKYEDPWPLDDAFFLCARMTGRGEETGLYLVDRFGNETLLHRESPGCFDPMPLAPRPRPPTLPTRRNYANQEGYFYVLDVYQGTHMQGVERGAVRWLRVVEVPEKRAWTHPAWVGQGQEAPAMNWHDFNNKRILGTVPVEPDGSAYFAVPAERFVYFQLLDERGMMIQSMRSGAIVQSGEYAGCVGCHEDRRTAPDFRLPNRPLALRRPPSRLEGWHGPPRLFNYLTEVQPVFDRHCVRCHDFGKPAGDKLNLAADRNLVFNVSYNELWRKGFIRTIGAGPADIQPALSWGSHASRLIQVLLAGHYDVALPPEDFDRLVTWIDINAPYYPRYESAHPANLAGRSPLNDRQLARLEELTGVPLRKLADHRRNRGPQVCFDRPELSPCLASLPPDSPAYREALAIIRAGRRELQSRPEADHPAFVACSVDQWRNEKYERSRELERLRRRALAEGQRTYEFDALPARPSPPPGETDHRGR
ncbi:MAG: hypothetical protein D6766_06590 [Verrucomicrobia bacterium]|nr:MAG: hypothetical protein D6766_06590 [Verrucomicrobiota bacterium]